MKKERFEELADAIRHAKAARRGDAAPARVWEVTRGKDGKIHRRQLDPEQYRRDQKAKWENVVTDTRSKLRLSQNKFAELARHLRQNAAQLGTRPAQTNGRGAGASARGITSSRSGFGRSGGVKIFSGCAWRFFRRFDFVPLHQRTRQHQ